MIDKERTDDLSPGTPHSSQKVLRRNALHYALGTSFANDVPGSRIVVRDDEMVEDNEKYIISTYPIEPRDTHIHPRADVAKSLGTS